MYGVKAGNSQSKPPSVARSFEDLFPFLSRKYDEADMSRAEILNGLRVDGRRWNELRHHSYQTSIQPTASGSSLISQGNTTILCTINGPMEPTSAKNRAIDRASINVDFTVGAFSTLERKKRSKNERRIQEINLALKQTFEEAVQTQLYPRSQIDISVLVMEQDGGVLQTAINAVTLALVDAGIPMNDYICATSAGLVDENAILDLNNIEEADIPHCTIATLGKSEKITLIQSERPFPMESFETLLSLALSGCEKVHSMMVHTTRERSKQILQTLARAEERQ